MLTIPITSEPAQSLSVQLEDGNKYTIDMRWNERSSSWTLDMTRDSDQFLFLAGVPMLLGQDILAPYHFGIGGLTLTDLSKGSVDASFDDLGDRVILTSLSDQDLSDLGAIAGIVRSGGSLDGSGSSGPGGGGGGPSLPPSGPPVGGGGGGVGGGTTIINNTFVNYATALVDTEEHADPSGTEVVISEFAVNMDVNPGATVTLDLSFRAASASGTATYRAYVGGAFGALDGVLVNTRTRSASTFANVNMNGSIAKPSGIVPVKVTVQSSGAGVDAFIRDLTGSIG